MKLPLSPRLLGCAGAVPFGAKVADVGCDHGYLGIHLLQNGIADTVYACDINEGPLQTAHRNAHKFGCADKMRFFLSDGLKNVPRDFDTLVCAGMGAETMISILEAAPWLKIDRYRLILQCQIKTHLLRRYLSENGWRIAQESVLRDGRFLYTVMQVFYDPCYPRLIPGEWYFPPGMLENPGSETIEYYRRTTKSLRTVVNARGEQADSLLRQALQELEALPGDPALDFLKEEMP